jgi:hypothetical protein
MIWFFEFDTNEKSLSIQLGLGFAESYSFDINIYRYVLKIEKKNRMTAINSPSTGNQVFK